jgi:hypothetical protein
VIVSGSGYIGLSLASPEPCRGESGCSVVDEDIESSASEALEGVGELPRNGDEDFEVVRCFVRIFWVILL